MFASQLLRILQIIPADVTYETWVFDSPEVKLTMKENQNEFSCPANGSEKKADSVAFEIDDGNDSASVTEFSEVLDRSKNRNDKEITDCQKSRDQEGSLCHSNRCQRDLESVIDNDESWGSTEIERSIIIDSFTDRSEKESGDSRTFCSSVSQLFELDSQTHFYADKNGRECELPELTVCYKENNYHVVKDICVDEGLPTQDKTLIKTDNGDHTGSFVSQPHGKDKCNGAMEGYHNLEPKPGGYKDSTIEDISNSDSSEHRTKEVDVATYFMDGSKSFLEDDATEDTMKVLGPGDLKEMSEANCSTAERTGECISEDESATSRRNSSQDLVVHDSRLQSSISDEIDAPKQLDEVPSVEAILESLAVAFTKEDSKKNDASSNLLYDSKVESGTITFDFNSCNSLDSTKDGSAENSHEESHKAEDVPNGKHVDLAEDVPNGKHGELEDNSTATLPPRASIAEKNEDVHEPKALSHYAAYCSNQIHDGGGESSFSLSGPVSGRITYSGPIAYSGSISLRSDSSTTSTRSFAFPVLQSEWNSSPVRMAKAERRHIRKNQGWRKGLFCCRF